MWKTKELFITTLIVLFVSCSHKYSKSVQNKISEKEIHDSTMQIVLRISDKWKYTGHSKSTIDSLALPELDEVTIQHWMKINTDEPINELTVSGTKFEYDESNGNMSGWVYDDKATIEYREDKFGLNLTRDSLTQFIGIKELNDSVLLLTNGQRFSRSNSYVR